MITYSEFKNHDWILDNRLLKIKAIIKACDLLDLPMLEQKAYIMATNQFETANKMEPVREAFWKDEAWRKANFRYYPWYGRGDVQLTWLTNYQYYKDLTGVDIISDPDLMITDKVLSLFVMVHGMATGYFNRSKQGLLAYINENTVDFINARRTVNVLNHAADIAGLAQIYLGQLQSGIYS